MRKALWCLVFVAACHSAPAGNVLTGADSPRSAVERFLAAARAQDMQALSVTWGNDKGPQRDQLERQELEKRELIMIALLRHDQAKISEPKRIDGGKMVLTVDLKQGKRSASPTFTTVMGPSSRWYVVDLDLLMLQNKGFGGKP